MAKKKKMETEQEEVIVPVTIEQTIVAPALQILDVPQGYVLLVSLQTDGSDKQGSEFFYPERSYRKYYGDETKFRVKAINELTDINTIHYENLSRTSQHIIQRTTGRCSSCGR
ncbi:MAG: hypothetical protein JST82_01590 [Bacteroidetes bacterium]|nr:hypothetical protein [Bacteroidota bacterium]